MGIYMVDSDAETLVWVRRDDSPETQFAPTFVGDEAYTVESHPAQVGGQIGQLIFGDDGSEDGIPGVNDSIIVAYALWNDQPFADINTYDSPREATVTGGYTYGDDANILGPHDAVAGVLLDGTATIEIPFFPLDYEPPGSVSISVDSSGQASLASDITLGPSDAVGVNWISPDDYENYTYESTFEAQSWIYEPGTYEVLVVSSVDDGNTPFRARAQITVVEGEALGPVAMEVFRPGYVLGFGEPYDLLLLTRPSNNTQSAVLVDIPGILVMSYVAGVVTVAVQTSVGTEFITTPTSVFTDDETSVALLVRWDGTDLSLVVDGEEADSLTLVGTPLTGGASAIYLGNNAAGTQGYEGGLAWFTYYDMNVPDTLVDAISAQLQNGADYTPGSATVRYVGNSSALISEEGWQVVSEAEDSLPLISSAGDLLTVARIDGDNSVYVEFVPGEDPPPGVPFTANFDLEYAKHIDAGVLPEWRVFLPDGDYYSLDPWTPGLYRVSDLSVLAQTEPRDYEDPAQLACGVWAGIVQAIEPVETAVHNPDEQFVGPDGDYPPMKLDTETGIIHRRYDPNRQGDPAPGALPHRNWTEGSQLRFDWDPLTWPEDGPGLYGPGDGYYTIRLWSYYGGFSPSVVSLAEGEQIQGGFTEGDEHHFFFPDEWPENDPWIWSSYYNSIGYPFPGKYFYVTLTYNPTNPPGASFRVPINEVAPDLDAWIQGYFTPNVYQPTLSPLRFISAQGQPNEDSGWMSGAINLIGHTGDTPTGYWTVVMGESDYAQDGSYDPNQWTVSMHFEEHDPPVVEDGEVFLGAPVARFAALSFQNFQDPTPTSIEVGVGEVAEAHSLTPNGGEEEPEAQSVAVSTAVQSESSGQISPLPGALNVTVSPASESDGALVLTIVGNTPTQTVLRAREWVGGELRVVRLAGAYVGGQIVPIAQGEGQVTEAGGAALQVEEA